MQYDFKTVMANKSDVELIAILVAKREEYSEAALLAAQSELDMRQLPEDVLEKVGKEQALIIERRLALANEPLDKDSKIIAMLFPFAGVLLYASKFRKDGYDRKLSELYSACWKGRMLYILMILLTFATLILTRNR